MLSTIMKYANNLMLLGVLPLTIVEPLGADANLIIKYVIISTVAAGVKALVIKGSTFRETMYMLLAGIFLGPLICFLIRDWGYISENIREFTAAACGAFADKTVLALQGIWIRTLEKKGKKIEDEL